MVELYRKASLAKAQALAIGIGAQAVPQVVQDLAAKSVDRMITCPTCRGTLTVKDMDGKPVQCENCAGTGTVLRESDLDRQKTLLDMMGLGKKGTSGTTIINTNKQINAGNVGSMFSTFVKATDTSAYDVDPGQIVEAAPVTEVSNG